MKVFFICYFRRSRWCVIIQFSAKDPKQESIKNNLPKTDVRYDASKIVPAQFTPA